MHKVSHFPIEELNTFLTCTICKGYLIDATTVIECLHSFCKSCIVTFLDKFNTCPVCDTLLHKTRPQYAIRADHVLQAIVYKLVPRLFENEMNLRKEFYSSLPLHKSRPLSPEKRGDTTLNAYIQKEEDRLSIELELWCPNDYNVKSNHPFLPLKHTGHKTYLLCPAGLTIGHIEKLIRLKFELKPGLYNVAVFFSSDDYLSSDYTLSDLACLYSWRRQRPMKLYFSIVPENIREWINPSCTPTPIGTSNGKSYNEEETIDQDLSAKLVNSCTSTNCNSVTFENNNTQLPPTSHLPTSTNQVGSASKPNSLNCDPPLSNSIESVTQSTSDSLLTPSQPIRILTNGLA